MLPFIAIVAAASLDWLISRLVRSESPPADDTAGAVGEPQLAELAR
jgi:hypothetical protein